MMVFLLLVNQLGLADSVACRVSNLTQSIGIGDTDPCLDGDQTFNLNAIRIHASGCGSLMLPVNFLDTTVSLLTSFAIVSLLQPQTAVTEPSTPPPRLI